MSEGSAWLDIDLILDFHADLLALFGLDARDPKFWDGGLSVIAGLITELETLDGAK
jgi:oligoendopeptidase F